MGDTTPTTATASSMSVNDVNALIAQQVQQSTGILMNRITELEDRNVELSRVINERQAGQPMGVGHASGHGSTIKAAKPSMYSGDMGSDVDAWLFMVLQYAYITGIADDDRVKWAATYLTGKAATWWRGMVMQQAEGDIDRVTWDQFCIGLKGMFKPVNAKKIARDKLAALKQTHSVAKYNYDITQLFLEIGDIHESEKLDRYVRGLKDKVRMEVELTEPTTLAVAMSKAQRVDGITYHSRMMSNMDHTSSHTYRTSNNDASAMDLGMIGDDDDTGGMSDTLNAMGVASMQRADSSMRSNNSRGGSRPFSPRQRVSQEVFRYCQEHRLCLRCKEPGHIARVCTKPVKPLNIKAH
jgi:hypothetical protein